MYPPCWSLVSSWLWFLWNTKESNKSLMSEFLPSKWILTCTRLRIYIYILYINKTHMKPGRRRAELGLCFAILAFARTSGQPLEDLGFCLHLSQVQVGGKPSNWGEKLTLQITKWSMLPCFTESLFRHYKDPYLPIGMMGCHKGFHIAQLLLFFL